MSRGQFLVPFVVAVCAAPAAGQTTTRVSVSSSGAQGNGDSFDVSISADGRFVAFASNSSALVPGDTNGRADVFVRDRATGVTERVSVDSDGIQANGGCRAPSISADGLVVAFESHATNLVLDDGNESIDIFVHDRATGETERVSVDSDGEEGIGFSDDPSLSADGLFVAFRSNVETFVSGDSGNTPDIFVHDRDTGVTEIVSVSTAGVRGNSYSSRPKLSADGQIVAFESEARNLVPDDTNFGPDVFVHDRENGVTELVTQDSDGVQQQGSFMNGHCISPDGMIVAFTSSAANLVDDDTNNAADAFVHDRDSGITTRVSVNSAGQQTDGHCFGPTISANGRYVGFMSSAHDLVPPDDHGKVDVFIHDRDTGGVELVSKDSSGIRGNENSAPTPLTWQLELSADGRVVAFTSIATNLVAEDTNESQDAFVHERDSLAVCRAGNVNAGAGPIADVLFVNGSSGDPVERQIVMGENDAFSLNMIRPPSKLAGVSRYALFAWVGLPTAATVRTLPYALGTSCMPMPLTSDGPPNAKQIWNNAGHVPLLGAATLPSAPAPTVILSKPGGLGKIVTFFLQGIIVDSAAPNGQAAVTNGIVVVLQ